MRLFNCKVRLGGSLLNEVRKEGITAAEIAVLRVIHALPGGSDDVVVEIKLRKDQAMDEDAEGNLVPRTDKSERARLESIYGLALKGMKDVGSLNAVFGIGQKLPDAVDGIEGEVVPDAPVVRTKVEPKAKKDALAELEA